MGVEVRGLQEARDHLLELARRGEHMQPAWQDVADLMVRSAEDTLASGGSGVKWAKLSRGTVDRHGPHQQGVLTGQMSAGFYSTSSDTSAEVRNRAGLYARIYQTGAKGAALSTQIERVKAGEEAKPAKWMKRRQPPRRLVQMRSKEAGKAIWKIKQFLRQAKDGAKAKGQDQ